MKNNRILSLDVLRGITIIMMTIVNNPGTWSFMYKPLTHSEWNGCTITDLIFPFFIFIVGVAIPLSMPDKKMDVSFKKITTRSLRIVSLGMFLFFFNRIEFEKIDEISLLIIRLVFTFFVGVLLMGNFDLNKKFYIVLTLFLIMLILAFCGIERFKTVRIPGVLQRIGVVYFFASLLYLKTNYKTQIIIIVAFLLVYWALMTLIPVPAPISKSPNLEPGTNLAAWIDGFVLNKHVYIGTKTWDPEGILSTLPAIANGMIGVFIGQILTSNNFKINIFKQIFLIGLLLLSLGLLWNEIFPINKSIWTSSYVLYNSGIASLVLAVLYYIIDIANYQKWTPYFLMWGVNPMLVFFASGIIPRALSMIKFQDPKNLSEKINLQAYLFDYQIAPYFSNPKLGSLIGSLVYVIIWSFILFFFYRKKRILKV